MGNMNKDSDMGVVVVETILAVPGVWFSNGVTWDGPLANTIQLLVHMLLGDQCTRFAISKMTIIKASMHSLSLLATGKYHGGDIRFRLAYEGGTVPMVVHPRCLASDGTPRHD
jgi:hypothetical protein